MGRSDAPGIPVDRPSGAVATADSAYRLCSECLLPIAKPRDNAKNKQIYCSQSCRFAAWERLHPRLDFGEPGYLAPRPLPEEPEARRDIGKAIAAANNRHQLDQAQRLALEYLASHPVAIISDIRAYAEECGVKLEWWKSWSANVFMISPWFELTGVRRKTTHRGGNARKVNEYRLTEEGWRAYREMGRK